MTKIDKQAIEASGHQAIHAERTAERSSSHAAKPHAPSRAETKQNLKTLAKNSSVHKLRNASRIVKYGTSSFTRNIWLSIAATLVMTVTLVILMATVFASAILSSTAETMRNKIDITIFFQPGTDQATLAELSSIMSADSNVKEITTADSQAEYESFIAENQDSPELLTILDDEAMRQLMLDTMQATMRIKVHDPSNLDSIRQIVEHDELFTTHLDTEKTPTYDVNQAEIETINSWASIAKNGGLILGAVFLVISVLVIFNTIRMAIFSRREEIYMMKLVGADPSFIRGPFLIEAQICGIISGLLASTIGLIAFRLIAPNLEGYGIDVSVISTFMDSSIIVAVYGVVVLLGVVVGTVSARLAMRKYLR